MVDVGGSVVNLVVDGDGEMVDVGNSVVNLVVKGGG